MNTVFINGYGATKNIDDGNYATYLTQVTLEIRKRFGNGKVVAYLCGGYTNLPDLTEAETIKRIWEHHGIPPQVEVKLITESTTARDNLKALSEWADEGGVLIFCEYSRVPAMEYLASLFFKQFEVCGIPFDQKSLSISHLIKQQFWRLPLEQLAVALPPFEMLRTFLRNRHVARERAKSR